MHVIDSLMLLNDSAVDAYYNRKDTWWVADEDEVKIGDDSIVEVWRRSETNLLYSQEIGKNEKVSMETLEPIATAGDTHLLVRANVKASEVSDFQQKLKEEMDKELDKYDM